MTNTIDLTNPRGTSVECTDALGRPRALDVFLNAEGRVCFRTPPGESAQLDWFQVDMLRRHLAELRPQMPCGTPFGTKQGGQR
ncbi:MAG: hypothetical protein ABIQ18_35425 [Umezawaea sp.]